MRPHRSLALGLSLIGVLGLSAVRGQSDGRARKDGPLDPGGTVSVRLLLGVGDTKAQSWGGRVKVDKGEVVGVEGWRFRQDDKVTGTDSWEARTRALPGAAKNKKAAKQADSHQAGPAPVTKAAAGVVPNGVIVTLKAPDDASLALETERGRVSIPLADLAAGAPRRYLDGQVEAQRVPASAPLVRDDGQQDYPAAAADRRGALWVAYVDHRPRGAATLPPNKERPKAFADYVPRGGGDRVRLLRFADGLPGDPLDVTDEGLDVWRPSVAVAGDGSVVVAWSEFLDGNWDVHSRTYDPERRSWSGRRRLTSGPGTDSDVALATAADGRVWMAWQAWDNGQADIRLAPLDDASSSTKVSDSPSNEWSPALAADKSGNLHVAFDTYQAGNYDVVLRSRSADGALSAPVAIASSERYEARPSVAVDPRGRVWVAYEERTPHWGKDAGAHDQAAGTTLYRAGVVRVRGLDGRRLIEAPDPVAAAPEPLRAMNNFPRLASDREGRLWLAYRHRQEQRSSPVGGTWIGYATSLSGREWSPPQALPRSGGMLDSRASLVVPAAGPSAWAVYVGDDRFQAEADRIDADLQIAALSPSPSPGAAAAVEPAATDAPAAEAPTAAVHPNEPADVARVRGYRVEAGGKTYQLLRGEFHRHTEFSADGGGDGALEDMWRYALDAARLDWIGNGDHDNGGGKEYTWWIVQKTTDLYHVPPAFTPMFTYERSVTFPHGHRNVMFDHRGVRTLPRLQAKEGGIHDDDTKMLYDYLKELGGICASHTSTTSGMGTDWRDNDPKVEPVVEIYQGIRDSYEHFGAPRVARRATEAVGGFQPYGMVWNALAMQYKLGFQSSSDHISTHISFAVAIAERHDRAAILDAFKRRHCYAATDNIVLDVRSGDHLMGDEFDAEGPVQLRVLAHGTRPIARVDIIKDFVYVYSTEPRRERVEFTWTDSERRPADLSWYYVRLIQDDGELAWCSPFWVHTASGTRVGARTTGRR